MGGEEEMEVQEGRRRWERALDWWLRRELVTTGFGGGAGSGGVSEKSSYKLSSLEGVVGQQREAAEQSGGRR